MDIKIDIGWGIEKLSEEEKKFITDVMDAFIKVEKVEKIEIGINREDMTAYVVIGKDFLGPREIKNINEHLARYEFNISFDDGKIEVLVGDY